MASSSELLLSCEHATAFVPRLLASHFTHAKRVLETHEGYDIGALPLAEAIGRRFSTDVIRASVSRLVVDTNRSTNHPRLFSRFVAGLTDDERAQLLATYYTPHRDAVAVRVAAAVALGRSTVHIGVHTFTPTLAGTTRRCDVGLLYDPQRPREVEFCRRWQAQMQTRAHELRVRRNYPYRGAADGLTRYLRRQYDDASYIGVELEMNQALAGQHRAERSTWFTALVESLAATLAI